MKRHAHSTFWFLYWGVALLGALLVVAWLVIRTLVQDISDYRQDIEQQLSTQLNARVHIAVVKGHWIGPDPIINLKGLSIDGLTEHGALSLALLEGDIALDTWASIKQFSPIFSRFDLSGLTVRYDLAKRDLFADAGEDLSSATESTKPITHSDGKAKSASSGLLGLLLQQRAIALEDAKIVIHRKDGKALTVSPIQVSLTHDGQLHQLEANADLVSESSRSEITFIAEVEGNPKKDPTNLYLNISDLDQVLLNPWLAMADLELGELNASQEIWGQLDRGKLTYLTGKTAIETFRYAEYAFSDFSLHTALLRSDRGYQLQLMDLLISGKKQQLQLPHISLDVVRKAGKLRPELLMVDEINLQALNEWSDKQNYLPSEISTILATLAPHGSIRNLNVNWPDQAALTDFNLQADLVGVGISAWDDVPEIRGINGLLMANMDGGAIHLQSNDFAMKYPTLFEYRWDYNLARGVIGWRFEDEGVVLASELLNLRNKALSAAGRFSLYLPFSDDEQPLLNLQIGVQNGEGLQAKYYIPPEEVGQETYDWLVAAIKAGYIKQAGFVLNGVTRTRLDSYQMPAVQMFFDVADAEFAYQPGWPDIKGTDAFVVYSDGELVAEAQGGHILDSKIGTAWLYLPESSDQLFITGDVQGGTGDLHKILTETPLRKALDGGLDEWSMFGVAETQVDIDLPLEGTQEPQVQVQSVIENGGFGSQMKDIQFSNIAGTVVYDSRTGLSAEKLAATLFQQPVTASIKTQQKKTQVQMNGAVTADFLRDWLDLDLLRIAKGKLSYNARLDFCPGQRCNKLVVKSDLKGIAVDAPIPFAKPVNTPLPLTLVSDLGRTYQDNRSVIRLNIDDQLRAVMVNKGPKIERGQVIFGGGRPEIPQQKGLWIDGAVDSLGYDELSRFLQVSGLLKQGEGSKSAAGEQSAQLLHQISVSVKHFTFDNFSLDNVWVELSPQKEGWLVALDSPQVAGTVLIPERNVPYKVHLRHLVYASDDDDDEADVDTAPAGYAVEPGSLPAIDFIADQVNFNNKPIGRLSFAIRSTEQGAQLENIKLDLERADITGYIRWGKSGGEVTDLTVKLTSEDFSRVLKTWGYDKAIEIKALDAYLQLSWPGSPWAFTLDKADGEIQFTAKDGQVLDVGNTGNILRVFGILSLQSLSRRLKLDFSDLVESGVAFDQMKAHYKINQGIATTTEPFVMTGPSVGLAMQGSLDLVNETVEKDIEVALPVTGNIPLVSVLLGAPQVAGAVFLFDKIIGDPFEKFTTVKYHMSGDWGNPEIELKQREQQPEAQHSHDSIQGMASGQ